MGEGTAEVEDAEEVDLGSGFAVDVTVLVFTKGTTLYFTEVVGSAVAERVVVSVTVRRSAVVVDEDNEEEVEELPSIGTIEYDTALL